MSYRIPARHETELYIGGNGHICISQEDPIQGDDHVVTLEPADVPKVVEWLQKLAAERAEMSDEDFKGNSDTERAG